MTLAVLCKTFGFSWADAKTLTLNEVAALAEFVEAQHEAAEKRLRSIPEVR